MFNNQPQTSNCPSFTWKLFSPPLLFCLSHFMTHPCFTFDIWTEAKSTIITICHSITSSLHTHQENYIVPVSNFFCVDLSGHLLSLTPHMCLGLSQLKNWRRHWPFLAFFALLAHMNPIKPTHAKSSSQATSCNSFIHWGCMLTRRGMKTISNMIFS